MAVAPPQLSLICALQVLQLLGACNLWGEGRVWVLSLRGDGLPLLEYIAGQVAIAASRAQDRKSRTRFSVLKSLRVRTRSSFFQPRRAPRCEIRHKLFQMSAAAEQYYIDGGK